MVSKKINSIINELLAKNLIPDPIIRFGIRGRLANHLALFERLTCEERQELLMQHVASLKQSPIAIDTEKANEQHYEMPTLFFEQVLGKHKKYSSGYWDASVHNLDEAEARMLQLTCERAEIKNGDRILELGCGWGSLTLWMAEHYPHAQITAISNSQTQKSYIDSQLLARKINNVTVRTVNMIDYLGEGASLFDRVVSVEMLEHIKNYKKLFERIADWLKPNGSFFVHIFTHSEFAYHYETGNGDDWMARYFFTGGQMPSDDLLLYFQDDLQIENHWQLSGLHYQKTARAWLTRMDRAKNDLLPLIAETYGEKEQLRWWVYWRVFFMACEELWGYKNGKEWIVSHYLFRKRELHHD
ncbi:MAG: class I SAM-dependent methyltransferase [Chthoniobacterales bacterium]|nr:class I SAM-dependent methyltransferase [Chthoniobacterales bacterium]